MERLQRTVRALAAWEQIAINDANFARAVEAQASLSINEGRFAPAEARLVDALRSVTDTGRLDIVVIGQNEPLAFFHNQTENAGHFVTLRLEGARSNKDGIGARVVVGTAAGRQVAQRLGGGIYLSASDGRIHFGLGTSKSIQFIEVRWPSGQLDRWTDLAADTGYRLREGDRGITPLAGFSRTPASTANAHEGRP